MLEEHFTFTTSQLAVLAGFGSVITAQHRLASLHARGVLHRDRPFRPGGGSFEWHWMLGPIGAKVIAAPRGVTPIKPAKVAARWRKLFHGWRWDELHTQHAWFCTLIAAAQGEPDVSGELVAWRSPWHVSRDWKATTDGYGIWRYPDGSELAFVLLLDDPPRLGVPELRDRLTSLPDPAIGFTRRPGFGDGTVALVWCATLRREQVLRRAITKHLGGSTGMPVALACAQWADSAPDGLHDRVWLPLGGIRRREAGRLTLSEVAAAALFGYWGEVDDDELILYDDTDDGRHAA
ncbi:MAG TPA: replication-relaxation family protein [Pseudonocardiaceae bacterium]|nr:replication-relaxation family protein [Pseudonocardiaceae bacterium]